MLSSLWKALAHTVARICQGCGVQKEGGSDNVCRMSSTGVPIGVVPHTSERIVWDVDDKKLYVTQTIYRRPIETRWCKDWALAIAPHGDMKLEVLMNQGERSAVASINRAKTTRVQIQSIV